MPDPLKHKSDSNGAKILFNLNSTSYSLMIFVELIIDFPSGHSYIVENAHLWFSLGKLPDIFIKYANLSKFH